MTAGDARQSVVGQHRMVGPGVSRGRLTALRQTRGCQAASGPVLGEGDHSGADSSA